jgi:riboflavin kinase / FMN adenylyltransferase
MHKISGRVRKGRGYGRKIGYPTINISTTAVQPLEGVYGGKVTIGDKEYNAGIVVGPGNKVEAHMIGYKGNAYGKMAVIEIGKFIRKFKKFKTEKELITQIKKDLKKC